MAGFAVSRPILSYGGLSREEWEVFEDGAEKMGTALVSYLRSIMGDVQKVIESNQSGAESVYSSRKMWGKGDKDGAPRSETHATEERSANQVFSFQAHQVPSLRCHKRCLGREHPVVARSGQHQLRRERFTQSPIAPAGTDRLPMFRGQDARFARLDAAP